MIIARKVYKSEGQSTGFSFFAGEREKKKKKKRKNKQYNRHANLKKKKKKDAQRRSPGVNRA